MCRVATLLQRNVGGVVLCCDAVTKTGSVTNCIPNSFVCELHHLKAEISGFQTTQSTFKTVRYTVSYGSGLGHSVTYYPYIMHRFVCVIVWTWIFDVI